MLPNYLTANASGERCTSAHNSKGFLYIQGHQGDRDGVPFRMR